MIDGIKIEVPPRTASDWLNNKLLDFHSVRNTAGRMIDGKQFAKYRGLLFFIEQTPNGVISCSLRGSLHKYRNKGKSNADTFKHPDLLKVVSDLHNRFNIDPPNAILHNLEMGVNISTEKTAKTLINNLVSNGNRSFSDFNIDRKKMGKVISKDRFKVKIYDKGKQEQKPIDNLIRIEIAVKKMQYLKPFDISTLADLMELDKVKPLGALLVGFWQGSIYYDKQVNYKEMSDFQRKKILYYATPRNWEDFTPIQRTRAKTHFHKLICQFGRNSDHQKITDLIAEKWNELTADKCICMHHGFKTNESEKMYMNAPLNEQCEHIQIPSKKNNINLFKKSPKTKRKCLVCTKDISHKKANAVFCSKHCNNSHHAKKRKQKRHKLKKSETEILGNVLERLDRSRLCLLVEYRHGDTGEAFTFSQSEINAPPEWTRRVIKATVLRNKGRTRSETFTSHRAKRLIREISKLNDKKKQ